MYTTLKVDKITVCSFKTQESFGLRSHIYEDALVISEKLKTLCKE